MRPARRMRMDCRVRTITPRALSPPPHVRGHRPPTTSADLHDRDAVRPLDLEIRDRIQIRDEGQKDAHAHDPARAPYRPAPGGASARSPQCPRAIADTHPADQRCDRRPPRTGAVTTARVSLPCTALV